MFDAVNERKEEKERDINRLLLVYLNDNNNLFVILLKLHLSS